MRRGRWCAGREKQSKVGEQRSVGSSTSVSRADIRRSIRAAPYFAETKPEISKRSLRRHRKRLNQEGEGEYKSDDKSKRRERKNKTAASILGREEGRKKSVEASTLSFQEEKIMAGRAKTAPSMGHRTLVDSRRALLLDRNGSRCTSLIPERTGRLWAKSRAEGNAAVVPRTGRDMSRPQSTNSYTSKKKGETGIWPRRLVDRRENRIRTERMSPTNFP